MLVIIIRRLIFGENRKFLKISYFCHFWLRKQIFCCQSCLKLISPLLTRRVQSTFGQCLSFFTLWEIETCNFCNFSSFLCGVGVQKLIITNKLQVKPFDPCAFSKLFTLYIHLTQKVCGKYYFPQDSSPIMKQIWLYITKGHGGVLKLEKSQSASERFSWEHIFSSMGYARLSENHSGIRKCGAARGIISGHRLLFFFINS